MRNTILRTILLASLTACTSQEKGPNAKQPPGSGSDPGDLGGDPTAPDAGVTAPVCTAGAFGGCAGDDELLCDAAGDGFEHVTCASGCNTQRETCNECRPSTQSCDGASLDTCGPDGLPASSESCAQGCAASPAPHCEHLVPQYLPSACDAAATAALDISDSITLSTDDPSTCTEVVPQTGGPAICVVHATTITVRANAILHATGTKVLALVADGDVTIDGTIDVSAQGKVSGPGGGFVRSGGTHISRAGGGGAGFHTAGGPGGSISITGGANNGGAATADPATLAALMGGPAAGGGGGGAATLIACAGDVHVGGTLSSGGGGGVAADGGGAGGYIVLQGYGVHVTGRVFANGGGGAAGLGEVGADATATLANAPGGTGKFGGGNGGAGAVASQTGQPGQHPGGTTILDSGGGGGGGVGFFQTYTAHGVAADVHPSVASPAFQQNLAVSVR
jgi:hypothetical protein